MKQVKCPSCKEVVPFGKYCIYCGSVLSKVEVVEAKQPVKLSPLPTITERIEMLEEEVRKIYDFLSKSIEKHAHVPYVRSSSKYARITVHRTFVPGGTGLSVVKRTGSPSKSAASNIP